jgi:hypothetical protein
MAGVGLTRADKVIAMADQSQTPQEGHFHAVRFHKDDADLSVVVADFLRDGLVSMQPALVIATPEHRLQFAAQLQEYSFDVALLEATGDLFLVDADTVLGEFMIDGMPDASRFTATMVPLIERCCRGRKRCTIRACGEMVDLLWRRGQTVAAIRLEMLWNDLARTHDFSLLCGYSMGSFYKDAAVEDANADEISRHHTHVITETGGSASVN